MNLANLWFYLRLALFGYLGIKGLYYFFAEGWPIGLIAGVLFSGLVIYDLWGIFIKSRS